MSNLAVHFSSKTDDWATPQWLFDELNVKYGPFELDVCASELNRKCNLYLGPDHAEPFWRDGLAVEWKWSKCWMNPPYGREIRKWVKKAYEESTRGCLVVCLLPARTDTRWFHDYCYSRPGVSVEFLKGRLKFGEAKNSAPFPSMVVIFHPPNEHEVSISRRLK